MANTTTGERSQAKALRAVMRSRLIVLGTFLPLCLRHLLASSQLVLLPSGAQVFPAS